MFGKLKIIWCLIPLAISGIPLLPGDDTPSASLADRVSELLEAKLDEKLDPLKAEISQIGAEMARPRFKQEDSFLSHEAKDSLASLIEMFRNRQNVEAVTPPGVPPMTPSKLADLITSSVAQSPGIDSGKVETYVAHTYYV